MIMFDTIFAMFAAIITMIISGLLVRKQRAVKEEVEEFKNENHDRLDEMISEVRAITGKEPVEHSIEYLEDRMETFSKTLIVVKSPTFKRRNKSVKR